MTEKSVTKLSSGSATPDFLRHSWTYRNWRAYQPGSPVSSAEEIYLYSDARFLGEFRTELGPYQLLNTIPEPHDPGTLVPALVLRLSSHLPDETEQIIKAFGTNISETSAFTGGSNVDEIASLVSLAHGVRIAVGQPIRSFYKNDPDPRGSPLYYHKVQVLPEGDHRNVIPSLKRSAALCDDLLSIYPKLEWNSARALARAARSYRQGIWISSADGNLCWLFLVSAIETAANEWAARNQPPELTPAQLLRFVKNDYAEELEMAAGEMAAAVLDVVGRNQNGTLRAQRKFVDFLLQFGLIAPEPKARYNSLDWSPGAMKKAFETVYKYRSRALHESEPFPLPMCYSPHPHTNDETKVHTYGERPSESTYQHGALWTAEQLPMNLYVFHHIVLGALRRWWSEMPRAPLPTAEMAAAEWEHSTVDDD